MAKVVEEGEDLARGGAVKGSRGFVGDEQGGTAKEGERDENALAHATTELIWIEAEDSIRHPKGDAVKHLKRRTSPTVSWFSIC
jgi:hypothetical protein